MTHTHGFEVETLLTLTRRGYASARRAKMRAGDHTVHVAYLRITEEVQRVMMILPGDEARRITANIARRPDISPSADGARWRS